MRRYASLSMIMGGLFVLALACSPAQQTAPPQTFAEAAALAAETGKPLLVDFFATW